MRQSNPMLVTSPFIVAGTAVTPFRTCGYFAAGNTDNAGALLTDPFTAGADWTAAEIAACTVPTWLGGRLIVAERQSFGNLELLVMTSLISAQPARINLQVWGLDTVFWSDVSGTSEDERPLSPDQFTPGVAYNMSRDITGNPAVVPFVQVAAPERCTITRNTTNGTYYRNAAGTLWYYCHRVVLETHSQLAFFCTFQSIGGGDFPDVLILGRVC